MLMKNKKGAGHVEVVVSFVIFISLVSFLLIAFKPLKIFSRVSNANMDITEEVILKKISSELSVLSIGLDSAIEAGECFYIKDTSNLTQERVVIKDENRYRIEARKENSKVYFKSSGKNFYKIYSSEEFSENSFDISGCVILTEEDYVLGVPRSYGVVLDSKLKELNESYYADYSAFKEEIGLKNDFNLIVRNISGSNEIIFKSEIYKPSGVEIVARDVPIEVLDSGGELKPYILNIQVWD